MYGFSAKSSISRLNILRLLIRSIGTVIRHHFFLNFWPHPLTSADVLYGRPFFCQKFFSRSGQKKEKSWFHWLAPWYDDCIKSCCNKKSWRYFCSVVKVLFLRNIILWCLVLVRSSKCGAKSLLPWFVYLANFEFYHHLGMVCIFLFNLLMYIFRKSATWKKFADNDLVSKFEDLKCTLISSEKKPPRWGNLRRYFYFLTTYSSSFNLMGKSERHWFGSFFWRRGRAWDFSTF